MDGRAAAMAVSNSMPLKRLFALAFVATFVAVDGWWRLVVNAPFFTDQLQHLLSSESCSFGLSGFLLRLVMVVVRPFFGLGLVNADDYGQSDWVNSYLRLGPMHKITWCARFHGLVKTTESMSTYPISYSFSISFRLAAWDIIHLLPSSNQIS